MPAVFYVCRRAYDEENRAANAYTPYAGDKRCFCSGMDLLENCTVLGTFELAQKFEEMGGDYTALADRTRRHEVNLLATPQRIRLANHLQSIGYITSWEGKKEKIFDPALKKETSRKLLKLRIRKIKQPN